MKLLAHYFFLGLIFITLAISCIGCSTGRDAEQDAQSENYHQTPNPYISTINGQVEQAAAIPAVGLAAVFSKDYYKASKIGGDCKYENSKSTFALPCRNVIVILTDSKGKEISRKQIDDNGSFVFSVKPNTKYLVKISDSKNYESYQSGLLESGQKILIPLKTK